MEDLIEEADQRKNESEESSEEKRPKKRKKKSHHKNGSTPSVEDNGELPSSIYMKPDDPRLPLALEKEKFELEKEELKMILLRHPDLDVSKQLNLVAELDAMSKEELHRLYKASKDQLLLQSPHHDAENMVVLVAQILVRWTKNPDIYYRVTQDTRLIAAVNTLIPELGPRFSGPLECVGRLVGHVWDAFYPRNKE